MFRRRIMIVTAALVVACSEDSGPPLDSGLPADKRLDALTTRDSQQFCGRVASAYTSTAAYAALCKIRGIEAARPTDVDPTNETLRSNCSSAYRECMDAREADEESLTDECLGDLPMCTATVEQAEECVNDRLAAGERIASKLPSCDDLTIEKLEAVETTALASPPSCGRLSQSCGDE